MKSYKYILPLLVVLTAFQAQAQPVRKSRIRLEKENRKMARELDSLRRLVEDYRATLAYSDSLVGEIMDIYDENDNVVGAGFGADNYTPDVTDSLLSIWYLHRKAAQVGEDLSIDLDSVRLSSNVPDSVYLKRLARMNSYLTLPYNETVRNYIILYSEKMPSKLSSMLGLSEYYFPIFEEVLSKYNMPEELKYVAVIESALNPVAVSRAGAKGMWQFMHNTAKSYGLKINSYVDERLDPVKSADAAARYLDESYRIFGDWCLAISSYNCGAGNVNKAIRRAGDNKEFWKVYDYLPRETRGYMPALVGAMYAFRYHKEHGVTAEPVQLPAHVDTFEIRKMLHFKQISDVIGIPLQELRDLNPQYFHDIIPGGEDVWTLRLPYQYTSAFIDFEDSVYRYKSDSLFSPATLQNIKNGVSSDSDRIVYKVKKGDYLGRIAARYHVTVNQIKSWNNLKSNNLRIGQNLVIYRRGSTPQKSSSTGSSTSSGTSGQKSGSTSATSGSEAAYTTYTVKSGDTLSGIAMKYPGVSANDIMKYNGLSGSKIKVGQKLKIPRK